MEITFKIFKPDVLKVLDEISYITEFSQYLGHNPKICVSVDEWNEIVDHTRKITFTPLTILDPPRYGEALLRGLSISCPEVTREKNAQKQEEKELKKRVKHLKDTDNIRGINAVT